MNYEPDLYHLEYRFSVLVDVDDRAALACLRGLAWECQDSGNKMTSVSGTGAQEWINNGRQATFYFTKDVYRQKFKEEFKQFFRKVRVISESNDEPAPRSGAY